MSFAEQTSGLDDRQRLGIFMWTVYEDLDSVVAVRRELFDGGGYLDFIDILPGAWQEVSGPRQEVLNNVLAADLDLLRDAGLTSLPCSPNLKPGTVFGTALSTSSTSVGRRSRFHQGYPRRPRNPRRASYVGSHAGCVLACHCVASAP